MPKRMALSSATKEDIVRMAESGQSFLDIVCVRDWNNCSVCRIIAMHHKACILQDVESCGLLRKISEWNMKIILVGIYLPPNSGRI